MLHPNKEVNTERGRHWVPKRGKGQREFLTSSNRKSKVTGGLQSTHPQRNGRREWPRTNVSKENQNRTSKIIWQVWPYAKLYWEGVLQSCWRVWEDGARDSKKTKQIKNKAINSRKNKKAVQERRCKQSIQQKVTCEEEMLASKIHNIFKVSNENTKHGFNHKLWYKHKGVGGRRRK